MSRRSEASHKTNNNTDFNFSILEHALNDPASKNLILQLLSANQKNVFELFKPAGSPLKTPVKRVKQKEHCESPTALLRRRELEKINRPQSAQSHTSEQSSSSGTSSTIPFDRILKSVIAYVEINSNGNDRSGGAKSLLKAMGATVSEKFTRDVTHVIFKDGLYTTYQRAKLLKVHLVSVLWLEATRRNGVRAQEKNYPALGTKNYDLNVSLICSQMQKDYEDVIRDEIRRTLETGSSLPSTKALLESRRNTIGSTSKSFDTSSQLVSQSLKNNEVQNILSKIRGQSISKKSKPSSMILHDDSPAVSTDEDLSQISRKIQTDLDEYHSDPFRPSSLCLDQNEVSDSTSECVMIDCDFSQKDIVLNNTLQGIEPLHSDEAVNSSMEITCTDDSDPKLKIINKNETSNSTKNMEITPSVRGNILQNLKGSILNSFSFLSSRNHIVGSSVERNSDEKENFFTPPNMTPKTLKLKSVGSKSTIKQKDVENDVVSTSTIDNEISGPEYEFYKLKTPKIAAADRKLIKPINILSEEYNIRNKRNLLYENNEDVAGSISMDISGRGKSINTSNTTDNSSLHKSSEINKKSTITSMSSLRLSKSSQDNSNVEISPENHNMESYADVELSLTWQQSENEVTDTESLDSTLATKRKKPNKRSIKGVKPTKYSNSNADKLGSTSEMPARSRKAFKRGCSVERKKQKTAEELEDTFHEKNIDVELTTPRERQVTTTKSAGNPTLKTATKSDVLDSPFVNTKPRRKSVRAVKETKEDCNLKAIVRGSTRRSSRINSAKSTSNLDTPMQSGHLDSPFVNTKPRRKSVRVVKETNVDCDLQPVHCPVSTPRRSSRINSAKSTSTPKKIDSQACISGKEVLPESHNDKESEEDKSVFETKELSSIMEEDELSGVNNSMKKSLVPVVLLQDVLNNLEVDKQSLRKTRRTVFCEDKYVESMGSISDKENDGALPEVMKCEKRKTKNDLSTDEKLRTFRKTKSVLISNTEKSYSEDIKCDKTKTEIKSRQTQGVLEEKYDNISNNKRKDSGNNMQKRNKFSRSKSESDVGDTTNSKTVKRIRKLYDPTQIESEEKIQESLGVNDQEERKTIRQEKVLKVNMVSQIGWLNGNVLMSQKAMDFLEKVKSNQDNMTMMFKKPETVLEELGIEKRRKDVRKKESIMNNSADEQVDLAEEFVNKRKKRIDEENDVTQKTPKTRKTMRNLTQKALTTGNSKRRSTMEFVPKPLNISNSRTKLILDQKPTIVCTKMHKPDVQMFNQIVKKLGRFEVEEEVSARTTHLVVGEPKRTINMLRALSRGCWIVKNDWLLSSLEEGRWLPEEKYEATEFSPAVQQCRLRRQAFGPSYSMNIFLDCGMIYVARSTTPRCSDLRELITLCEGKVTKILDNAKIVVGAYMEECDCVNELWVLDSISSGKLKPLEEYSINSELAKTKSPFV